MTGRALSPDPAIRRSAVLGEAGRLLLAAVALTAAVWLLRPDPLPLRADVALYALDLDAPTVSVADALALYEAGDHLFVDTRPDAGMGLATVPGAIPVREASFDDDLLEVFDFLTPDAPLVLFGDGSLLQVSSVAARLRERGFDDLLILAGGIEAWRAAGGDVREAAP